MAELKPAYLVHGDDHGAVAERRAGLRRLLEIQGGEEGTGGVEALEGEQATPAGAAQALTAMTLGFARRVIVVDGVERWRAAEVEQHLVPAMAAMPPDTTLALFAREEQRAKAPPVLHELVKRAGGQVVAQMTVKPWELAKWAREQASRLGLSLDAAAAKALVAQVGERQQRLLRELEKLALQRGEGEQGAPTAGTRAVRVEEVEQLAAHSAEWRAYGLGDAVLAADTPGATLTYLRLRQQGERISGLTYLIAARLRDALAVAARLQAGESKAEVKRTLRMPSRAADRLIDDVSRSDPERLRAALAALAALELDTRGGAPVTGDRGPLASMEEDTLVQRTIEAVTAVS